MSKNAKVALGIAISIVVLCLCACVGGWLALRVTGEALEDSIVLDNPEQAQTLAQSIIDYELPSGYQEQGAFNMGFMKMVLITPGGENPSGAGASVIMIAEMPANAEMDKEEMMLQIQLSMKRTMGNQNYEMAKVAEETTAIRGQEVTLLVYEGTNEQGVAMKQVVSGLFEGKNGLVMLMILGPAASWDQTGVEAFIRSIR